MKTAPPPPSPGRQPVKRQNRKKSWAAGDTAASTFDISSAPTTRLSAARTRGFSSFPVHPVHRKNVPTTSTACLRLDAPDHEVQSG